MSENNIDNTTSLLAEFGKQIKEIITKVTNNASERLKNRIELLEKVGECVKKVKACLEKNGDYSDATSKMRAYAKIIPSTFGKYISEESAKELSDKLIEICDLLNKSRISEDDKPTAVSVLRDIIAEIEVKVDGLKHASDTILQRPEKLPMRSAVKSLGSALLVFAIGGLMLASTASILQLEYFNDAPQKKDPKCSPGKVKDLPAIPVIFYSGQRSHNPQASSAYYQIASKIKDTIDQKAVVHGKKFEIILEQSDGAIDNCIRLTHATEDESALRIGLFQLSVYHMNPACNLSNLQYISPLYEEVTHVLIRDSLIGKYIERHKKSKQLQSISLCELINFHATREVSIGPAFSSTNYMARGFIGKCQGINDKSLNLKEERFDASASDLVRPDGHIDIAFYNQAPQSSLIQYIASSGYSCILSLDDPESETFRNLYKMSEYTPPKGAASNFYNNHSCNNKHQLNKKRDFSSLSSISVLAIARQSKTDFVEYALENIHTNISVFSHITPEFFNKDQASRLVMNDTRIQKESEGRIALHDQAKDWFSKP